MGASESMQGSHRPGAREGVLAAGNIVWEIRIYSPLQAEVSNDDLS